MYLRSVAYHIAHLHVCVETHTSRVRGDAYVQLWKIPQEIFQVVTPF